MPARKTKDGLLVVKSEGHVDKDALIAAIQKREALWRKRSSGYELGPRKLAPLWNEVVAELNIKISPESKKIVRGRWMSLKNAFYREWNKMPKTKSGEGASEWKSRNPYFNALKFLKENLQKRKTLSNNKPSISLNSDQFYESDQSSHHSSGESDNEDSEDAGEEGQGEMVSEEDEEKDELGEIGDDGDDDRRGNGFRPWSPPSEADSAYDSLPLKRESVAGKSNGKSLQKKRKSEKEERPADLEPPQKKWKTQQRKRPPTNSELIQKLIENDAKKTSLAEQLIQAKINKQPISKHEISTQDRKWMEFFEDLLPHLQHVAVQQYPQVQKAIRNVVIDFLKTGPQKETSDVAPLNSVDFTFDHVVSKWNIAQSPTIKKPHRDTLLALSPNNYVPEHYVKDCHADPDQHTFHDPYLHYDTIGDSDHRDHSAALPHRSDDININQNQSEQGQLQPGGETGITCYAQCDEKIIHSKDYGNYCKEDHVRRFSAGDSDQYRGRDVMSSENQELPDPQRRRSTDTNLYQSQGAQTQNNQNGFHGVSGDERRGERNTESKGQDDFSGYTHGRQSYEDRSDQHRFTIVSNNHQEQRPIHQLHGTSDGHLRQADINRTQPHQNDDYEIAGYRRHETSAVSIADSNHIAAVAAEGDNFSSGNFQTKLAYEEQYQLKETRYDASLQRNGYVSSLGMYGYVDSLQQLSNAPNVGGYNYLDPGSQSNVFYDDGRQDYGGSRSQQHQYENDGTAGYPRGYEQQHQYIGNNHHPIIPPVLHYYEASPGMHQPSKYHENQCQLATNHSTASRTAAHQHQPSTDIGNDGAIQSVTQECPVSDFIQNDNQVATRGYAGQNKQQYTLSYSANADRYPVLTDRSNELISKQHQNSDDREHHSSSYQQKALGSSIETSTSLDPRNQYQPVDYTTSHHESLRQSANSACAQTLGYLPSCSPEYVHGVTDENKPIDYQGHHRKVNSYASPLNVQNTNVEQQPPPECSQNSQGAIRPIRPIRPWL